MRVIIILWAVPLSLFWGWYALSFYDISFGTIFLSRGLHDLVFDVYGNMLGVPADKVPGMAALACAVDTSVLGAIAAFRWRALWYPQLRAWLAEQVAGFNVAPASRGEAPEIAPASAEDSDGRGAIALPDGPALPAE